MPIAVANVWGETSSLAVSMKQSKKITLTALCTALSVVLLFFGSVLDTAELAMAAIASLPILFIKAECGKPYPLLLWLSASLISFLTLPVKSVALVYALLTGHYPLFKGVAERLPPVFSLLAKLSLFAALAAFYYYLAEKLLLLPEAGPWFFVILGVLGLTAFFLYDLALSRLIVFYAYRIRPRIARFLH
ncbi:MAG: hypothetical protein MJ078_00570 [Clostridia bacterium]|nr:hypothetical protein [Clostridia bacterium]